ncbi:DUF1877 family protein [Paenarthrobacter sp. MSM-2-10-13]|uniref:DUF1877 family protein n=1 Tax=Micrococcaceae TaxID=1268 RepID=UPI00115E207F|nr:MULTISPECIES: DUF1877 family protein [Micrococcaceae]MCM0617577.1 DUF1877 family protein [Paenarthrobacter sp. TYUT067]NHW45572.1 DUF1877 family protein [Paenarthrobacter sp. MSM-2-10-13]TQS92312.1 DUF1877 family protein [Arthrobacter sp. TS-15]BCW63863.1 hypothetical protein StoSoilB22_28360 [Arthrobacter sp. StoSoilB22]
MGIRYYAYAFDADVTDLVLADPRRFLSTDPIADAWGLKAADGFEIATFEQAVPECDMLYLDKAWRYLQAFSAPSRAGGEARPAFRMFEGAVTMHHDGWESWVRVLPPSDVVAIAEDLHDVSDSEFGDWLQEYLPTERDSNVPYGVGYLQQARVFVTDLAAVGRGLVYLIG